MLRIGLTGGIGSGKSTVADHFKSFGIEVIDADKIAKSLLSDLTIIESIQKEFGDDIVDESGQINRSKMREVIFNHPYKKKWLENLIHPKVRAAMAAQIEAIQADYVLLDIPLMIETLPNPLVDKILVVECDKTHRLQRIMVRDNIHEQLAKNMIAQQSTEEERRKHADYILDNNGDLGSLHKTVENLHHQFLDLAQQG